MQPYLTVPFKFTEESFTWLNDFLEPMVVDYNLNAPRQSALLNFNLNQIDILKSSVLWQEIIEFANQYGLKNPFPQLFIYKGSEKRRPVILGNPHIDTAGEGGIATTVEIRFNILVNG